jgi:hypothetical protein
MPRTGEPCPYSSFRRRTLDRLTRPQEFNNYNPPVKSRVVSVTGTQAGRRLINYRSLMEYIESLPVELPEAPRKREALANYRLRKAGADNKKPHVRRAKKGEVA